MDLEQFKSQWQENDPGTHKSVESLKTAIKMKQKTSMNRFQLKLILESVGFTAFLLLFYDAFDGSTKPMALNILLGTAFLALIGHNLLALRNIYLGLNGENLVQSLGQLSKRFRLHGRSAAALLLWANVAWMAFAFYGKTMSMDRLVVFGVFFLFLIGAVMFNLYRWEREASRMEDSLAELQEE